MQFGMDSSVFCDMPAGTALQRAIADSLEAQACSLMPDPQSVQGSTTTPDSFRPERFLGEA